MRNTENNYAFIDCQNIHKGIEGLGWILDWRKFRIYLKEKYGVTRAYLFLGYIPEYHKLYQILRQAGFILKFKPAIRDDTGKIKGNVDADLVLQAMIDRENYTDAVIISSDGDFYSLVNYLIAVRKLKRVICPSSKTCSSLLKKSASNKIDFLETCNVLLAK
jgi:uncharacterized LabA/DUF88 family protein